MMKRSWLAAGLILLSVFGTADAPRAADTARIKDIASLQSGRDNQLIGYGLIVGLQGTGDGLRSSPFTEQSMRAMLQNLGISTQGGQSSAKNVAAVMVTANLHPSRAPAGPGCQREFPGRRDVAAWRYSDHDFALRADGQIYAVAQGAVVVSGFRPRSGSFRHRGSGNIGSRAERRHHRT